MSQHEEIFAAILKEKNIPFEREYRFAAPRRFRADFALLDSNILVEIEGAIFVKGRHTSGVGYERDCEKYNIAAAMGYKVYRIPTHWITKMDKRLSWVLDHLKS